MEASSGTHAPLSIVVERLAIFAILGIALYIFIDVVLNFLPPYYSLMSQPESDYAVGPYGFLMAINFVLRGLFSFALVFALYRAVATGTRCRTGLILLCVWAVGAFLLAVFPTELGPGPHSPTAGIHALVALVAFLCAALGELLISVRFAGDERLGSLRVPTLAISALALPVYLAFVLSGVANRVPGLWDGLGSVFGLVERVFLGLILLWMFLVALKLRSAAAREERPG